MVGSGAIESNRAALVRIVAALIVMAGLDPHPKGPQDVPKAEGAPRRTLPRHLWLAILRLLRPAEAAARRLIIATARGLVVPPPRPGKVTPKPADPAPLLRSLGIAVTVSSAGLSAVARPVRRSPQDEGARGKGDVGAGLEPPRLPAFPLFDPLRRVPLSPGRRYVPARVVPRILFPGITEPFRIPPRRRRLTTPSLRPASPAGPPHLPPRSTTCRARPGASRG